MNKLRYLIIGSGWRAEFYGRIARTYPDLFEALFLCRSEEKAALMYARTDTRATTYEKEAERFHPDFVVVAVNKSSLADVCIEWAGRGYAVLSETPAGSNLEQLNKLWEMYTVKSARIAVSEQYHRYPELIAGLDAVAAGRIGRPGFAYLSLAHDYHAASLLRRMLLTAGEEYTLRGESFQNTIVETDSRYGPITDGRLGIKDRNILFVEYASGKRAVYDFSGVQYHSFLRTRHLTVRGERGEWSDNLLLTLDADGKPQQEQLMQRVPEQYSLLDTPSLAELRQEWRPELRLENCQDEFAIASVLLDMGKWLSGGTPPYPLQEALDDAAFWLLSQQALLSPWRAVHSENYPWHVS